MRPADYFGLFDANQLLLLASLCRRDHDRVTCCKLASMLLPSHGKFVAIFSQFLYRSRYGRTLLVERDRES